MKKSFAIIALLASTACSQQGEGSRAFSNEAGALLNFGSFGDANMNNQLVMTGQQGHVTALANRFADEVQSTVNFEFDSAQLDAEARRALTEQANWIRQFPEVRFRVYGHTDAVGSHSYNKALGMRRAQAVVAFLTSQGISHSRLEAVVSLGKTQPLIVTQGRERRNRRTVTEVNGFVQNSQMIMDGKYAEVIQREYLKSAEPTSTLIMMKNASTTQQE